MYRIIAVVLVAGSIAAVAGSIAQPSPALVTACVAAALSVTCAALLWRRPAIVAALAALWMAIAFAVAPIAFPRLSAQDSAAVAVAAALAAIAVGASALVKNAIARIIVVLVALYALLPTVASIGHGGLQAAFAEGPFAQTRGTYLAVEILVPIAALGALVVAVRHVIGKRGASAAAAFAAALALLAVTQFGATAAGDAGLPTIVAFEKNRGTSAGVIGTASTTGSDASDLARVADSVTNDVYAGVFQGAAGTRASGSGNAADKALLLRDTMKSADPNVVVRFATCVLTAAQADRLLLDSPVPVGPKIVAQIAPALAAKSSDPVVKDTFNRSAQIWSALTAQARDETTKLAASLAQAKIAVRDPSVDELRATVAQHVWLQQQVPGGWADLDPSIPHATPGQRRCDPQRVTNDLPDDAYDRIAVKLRVEELREGALRQRTVLEGAWRTADLNGEPLAFTFAEPADIPIAGASAPPAGFSAYTPIFRVGDTNAAGSALYLPTLTSAAESNPGAAAGNAAAGALEAFGTPSPGATSSPTANGVSSQPALTAAWLDIDLTATQSASEHASSPIFDRVGIAKRKAGDFSAPSPFHVKDGAYLELATVWSIVTNDGAATTGSSGSDIDLDATDTPHLIQALSALHRSFYATRRAFFETLAASQPQAARSAHPAVSLLGLTFVSNGNAAPASDTPRLLMDTATAHVPISPSGASSAVEWGVSSVLAERAIVEGGAMLAATTPPVAATLPDERDVLGVFESARRGNIATRAVDSSGAAQTLDLVPDAKARLAESLTDGTSALVPERMPDSANPEFIGWWLVSPGGSVRDQMASGRHQMAEEAEQEREAVKMEPWYRRVGRRVRCVAVAASVALSAISGDPSAASAALKAEANAAAAWARTEEKVRKAAQSNKGGCGAGT